jgi:hypothetical protein
MRARSIIAGIAGIRRLLIIYKISSARTIGENRRREVPREPWIWSGKSIVYKSRRGFVTVLEDWGDWKGVVDRMSLSGLRSMLAGQAPQRWYIRNPRSTYGVRADMIE